MNGDPSAGGLWTEVQGADRVLIGVTKEALESLGGEITYLGIPDVGTAVRRGHALVELESAKATLEFVSPVSGSIVEVNGAASADPSSLSASGGRDPWLVVVRLASETSEQGSSPRK